MVVRFSKTLFSRESKAITYLTLANKVLFNSLFLLSSNLGEEVSNGAGKLFEKRDCPRLPEHKREKVFINIKTKNKLWLKSIAKTYILVRWRSFHGW